MKDHTRKIRRPRWSNRPLRTKIFTVMIVPIVALLGSTATFLFALHYQQASDDAAQHAITVRQETQEVQTALAAVSSAAWGNTFGFATGSVDDALKLLSIHLADLRAVINGTEDQVALLSGFEKDVRQRVALETHYAGEILRNGGKLPKLSPKVLSDAAVLYSTGPEQALTSIATSAEQSVITETRAASHARSRVLMIVILAGALGTVGGLGLMAFAITGIVRRIRRVGDNARRLAAGEALEPLPPSGDEVGKLAAELAEAAGLLQKREEEMRRATEEAKRADLAKSEFLSRMSHELRTPLNSILGFAQLLEMSGETGESHEDVKHILRAGRHLLALIDEVLDIARIEAGEIHCSIEPVWVDEVLREVAELAKPLADPQRIRVLIKPSNEWVRADRQRVKQVLLNLVANAIKFNREGGTVSLGVQRAEGRTRIDVTDSGRGIAPDAIARLFVPFERLDALRDGIEGTGLGLALSRRLVEAMNGHIEVKSELGRGSTFTVDLPHEEPMNDVSVASPADSEPQSDDGSPIVLYIEDNIANLALIERVLGGRNVHLISAMQGTLGLELARRYVPQVILLDLHLPDLSGEGVLRSLRADPRTAGIPVIVISADATLESVARHEGVAAYITKPVEIPRFIEVLDSLLTARIVA